MPGRYNAPMSEIFLAAKINLDAGEGALKRSLAPASTTERRYSPASSRGLIEAHGYEASK